MTTKRELTVLQVIAQGAPATPAGIARRLGLGTGYAREVARHLTGRGLVRQHQAYGPRCTGYTITDAGLRELNGDG